MGTLLSFFGTGAVAPARIQALLIAALVMALTCAGLTTWALFERSGRLELKVENVRLEDQKAILADKLATQNAAVDAVNALGQQLRGDIKKDLAGLAKNDGKFNQQIATIDQLLKQIPRTRPDGKPADCGDAWRDIQKTAKPAEVKP